MMRWRSLSVTAITLVGVGLLVALSTGVRSQAQLPPAVAALPPAWVLPPPAQVQAPQVVAVRAGRLFDAKTATLRGSQIILIRGDRIVEVGPSIEIPQDARVIDLSRATVLPGLIDSHLH